MRKLSESKPMAAEEYRSRIKADNPEVTNNKRITKEQEANRKLIKKRLKNMK